MDVEVIQARSTLIHDMSTWLLRHGYIEVSTPVLATDLIPESTIEYFATMYSSEFFEKRELYLVPSPEIHMKKIIAQIKRSIFQFSRCFRNGEQLGSCHNPEFTMLEYYTVGADDEQSIAITEQLIAQTALPGCPDSLLPPFRRMTVSQACKTYAGFDLEACQSIEALHNQARRLALDIPDAQESWEEAFHRIFLNCVEPNLPQDKPLVLVEYPEQIACLAQKIPHRPFRRRWELYAQGVELANCYVEEQDRQVIREFYQEQYSRLVLKNKNNNDVVIPRIDFSFADFFGDEFPFCSGVAMGFDRLLMLQLGLQSIEGVILFALSDMMGAEHTRGTS